MTRPKILYYYMESMDLQTAFMINNHRTIGVWLDKIKLHMTCISSHILTFSSVFWLPTNAFPLVRLNSILCEFPWYVFDPFHSVTQVVDRYDMNYSLELYCTTQVIYSFHHSKKKSNLFLSLILCDLNWFPMINMRLFRIITLISHMS